MSLDDTIVSWNDALIAEEGANGKRFNLFLHLESLPGAKTRGEVYDSGPLKRLTRPRNAR
jgi:hypothetical protein